MSAYHIKVNRGRGNQKAGAMKTLTREVACSVPAGDTYARGAKDGLFVLCVEAGPDTPKMMFEQELEEKVGKKGKHNADRSSYRHSREPRKVELGGPKVRGPGVKTTGPNDQRQGSCA